MRRVFCSSFLLVVPVALFLFPAALMAGGKEVTKVEESILVLQDIMAIPEKGIPPSLLGNAYAVAVIPHVIKAGFVVGGRHGRGVVSVQKGKGEWSAPSFITITGGSVGWQIGVQSTDIILVFKSKSSVDRIAGGKFTMGADASIAAGPVGRKAAAATDIQLKAEIYSYSRSRGLFAGVALQGSQLQIDHDANAAFYGKSNVVFHDILLERDVTVPKVGRDFSAYLAQLVK